ncbi:MAG: nucleotidyltransferase domain-containing protein [Candidatus Korarchaeota archaeon]|nr:nucleotidyltransferase domain-containing protein [Candidatus Korarchaeota archaeon]
MKSERPLRTIRLSRRERAEVMRKVRRLVDRKEILIALLYGSFVERDAFRDLDVGVYLAPSADDLLIPLMVEEEIRAGTGLPADVRVLNNAPPRVLRHVLSRSVPLLERVPLLRERLLARALDEEQGLSLKAARSWRNLDP